ncbi:MAG: UDP-N-acetylmuramoyl-L-alanyl-D-glutamate--2,6-diaminopimelate ligase [Burkholderiales bacterium]
MSGVVLEIETLRPPRFDCALLNRLGVSIRRLVADSRKVRNGDTFAAFPGEHLDGRAFIPHSIAAGANAVLWDNEGFRWDTRWPTPNLGIAGLRERLGVIASHIYGNPSARLSLIGVTGTNGKTSCCHWLAQAFSALGDKSAVIGTLGNGPWGGLRETDATTPDAIALHELLRDFLAQGVGLVAMEASSHGLTQGRVNGVSFALALFTNLSRDHLDYHGDMHCYARAKAGLFALPGLKRAVLNLDDGFGVELAGMLAPSEVGVVGYGFEVRQRFEFPVLRASKLRAGAQGVEFDVASPWGDAHLHSEVLGRFNAANLLAVLATLLASGVALEDSVRVLSEATPVSGRMQRLGGGKLPTVVIDYAHTPDALEKVLSSLRELMGTASANAKLSCVFGCGGDRDRGKRPLMGAVAARIADQVVITSDNPRSEDPLVIMEQIAGGIDTRNYRVIGDRAQAISEAISDAVAGDVVLIAGKGHETYQEIAGVKRSFSDSAVANTALGNAGWA